MPPSPAPLTLVILAAGRATRFGRLKQLVPIGPGGEALLDYALYDGALAGFSRFVLVIQEALRADFDAHLVPARAAGVDIRYACQRLAHPGLVDDPPPNRTRPWGTGHAVLTAGEKIDGPLAVCNADDFYGRGAYAALAGAMHRVQPPLGLAECNDDFTSDSVGAAASGRETRQRPPAAPAYTVGYPLEVTLSGSGGVSRGICEIDEAGALQRLTEGLELSRDGDRVRGRDVAGRPVDVPLQTPVCMNLWGFPPQILPAMRDLFAAFLADGPGPDREFFLSEAINDLVAAGRARCTVLPTRERWLGVTFPADHAAVARSLGKLVDSGVYPMRLWDAPPTPSSRD